MNSFLENRSRGQAAAHLDSAESWRKVPHQTSNQADPREMVVREISPWAGVTVHEHRFGGVEFRVGRREIGHLHATIADLPFPRAIRDELVAAGRARPHHILPDSGWVTVPMLTDADVTNLIQLFRHNYERAVNARSSLREASSD